MKSEKSSKRRRIEELRALENGVQSGEDVIYDGGEIVTSPAINFHAAALKDGGKLEHVHAE